MHLLIYAIAVGNNGGAKVGGGVIDAKLYADPPALNSVKCVQIVNNAQLHLGYE